MIAVVSHPDPATRAAAAGVLEDADWQVHVAADAHDALAACRRARPDVLFAAHDPDGDLLDRVKRDADLYRVAVVLLADDVPVPEALEALERGADDILRTPLQAADVLSRAFAAARTKALVEELTAQNRRLEELLLFDELTGLRNRRALLHELDMLVAGARRHEHPLALLMIDIDRFKAINDTYGHAAGDEVLREIARRLRGRLRRADVGGRLGGDELLVALPETDARGAAVVAESIRCAIAASPVGTVAGLVDVTVSIGSASLQDGRDLRELLEAADRALYEAKAAGRDSYFAA